MDQPGRSPRRFLNFEFRFLNDRMEPRYLGCYAKDDFRISVFRLELRYLVSYISKNVRLRRGGVGSGAMVAGVEDADEFVVGFEEGVGFVDHECGPEFFNRAIECRRADVGRDQRAIDEA